MSVIFRYKLCIFMDRKHNYIYINRKIAKCRNLYDFFNQNLNLKIITLDSNCVLLNTTYIESCIKFSCIFKRQKNNKKNPQKLEI